MRGNQIQNEKCKGNYKKKNKRTKINKETMKKNESKIQFTTGWSVNYVTTPNQLQIIRVKEMKMGLWLDYVPCN
jgi:hypothetical protein